MEIGILILRLVIGLTFAAHGAQKLFGWFGGYGLKATAGFMESLGFRKSSALAAGLGEFGGGLALALGLATPFAAAVLVAVMLVAIVSVHLKNGFFVTKQGWEYNFVLAGGALAVAFLGAGSLSIDALVGVDLAGTRWGLLALVAGVAGAVMPLSTRHVPAAEQSH